MKGGSPFTKTKADVKLRRVEPWEEGLSVIAGGHGF